LYLYQGQALFGLGRYSEALKAYKEGVEFLPLSSGLWRVKAQTLRALGRKKAATVAERTLRQLEQQGELLGQALV
jgi:tetratricopeptide (TPR) repeat protein